MNEQDYITPYDEALLLSRGFKYGISQEVLWGTSVDGRDWQAWEEGEYYKFGFLTPQRRIESRSTMLRETFDQLFPKKA